jgi:predicted nucleotidyltransferase
MRADEHNLANIRLTAEALRPLLDSLVFIGGSAVGLLVTDVRAQAVRMTSDVDLVAEAHSLSTYHLLETRFRNLGFGNDTSPGAPICRWRKGALIVDLMPTTDVLGFHNRWYALAHQSAEYVSIGDLKIRLIRAPEFIATKLEAFKSRGQGDYLMSHDLEDVLTVIDGREDLLDEVETSDATLKIYLGQEFMKLLATRRFVEALSGHLSSDAASQARLPRLLIRLQKLSEFASDESALDIQLSQAKFKIPAKSPASS